MKMESASRPGAFAANARDLTDLVRALYDEVARVMDATVFLFAVYDEASETAQVVRQMDRGVEHPLPQLFRRGYRTQSARGVIGGGLGLYFSNGLIAALREPQGAPRPGDERA